MKNKTVKVHIAVMDYAYSEIRMYTAKLRVGYQDEDITSWLYLHDTNWNDSQCYYMCSEDGIEVIYE